ncbi:hypothetical protein [Paenibacillus sp. FSL H3-0457]
MEFSIYKIIISRDNYIEFLTREYQMNRVGVVQVGELQKLIDSQEIKMKTKMDFFFKTEDENTNIEWFDYWKVHFQNSD